MSFNAGEIIATLKLDRTQFNIDLDKALAEVDAKTKDGFDVPVKPELDQRAMDEVLVEEEPLRADIEPEVKPQYARGEAESVGKTIAADILTGMEGSGGARGGGSILSGYFDQMFSQGVNKGDIALWARGLGKTDQEIKDAFAASLLGAAGGGGASKSVLAEDIAKSILPTGNEMDQAMKDTLWGGQKNKPDLLGQWAQAFINGEFASSGNGKGGFGTGKMSIAETLARGILPTSAEFNTALRGGINDLERNGGGVAIRRDFQAMLGKILGASGSGGSGGSGLIGVFDNLWGGSTAWTKAIFNPIGIAAGTAFLGAFGNVLGGGIAGTAIGGAGVFAALIPGYIDLMKGIQASSALASGASTKGMSKSQIALGQQIQKLIGVGSKGLGVAEITIMPDITKFAKALTTALPLINQFAKPAIKAMSGFFDSIDKGMSSGGFKSFIKDMSKLVGPTMKEFGTTILNLGGAFGGFLKVFGPVGVKQVGPWFEKITKEFDKFMNHIKIGPGFEKGSKTVFGAIGEWIKVIAKGLKGAGDALAPIGLAFFQLAGFLAVVINKVPLAAPLMVTLGTALVSLSIGLKAIALAQAFFGPAAALFDPEFLLFAAAATALYVAIKDLVSMVTSVPQALKQLVQWAKDVGGVFSSIFGGGGGSSSSSPLSGGAPNRTTSNPLGGTTGASTFSNPLGGTVIHRKPTHHVTINVDASGHKTPHEVQHAVSRAITATLPQLQAALARGAS